MADSVKTICPMLTDKEELAWCVKKECAWWFGAHECCSVPALGNILGMMVDNDERRLSLQMFNGKT